MGQKNSGRSLSSSTKQSRKSRPVLKVFLEGLYDEGSNLSKLRGCDHVIKTIWTYITDFYKLASTGQCVVKCILPIRFPPASGINVNMMPFIASRQFENCRLPEFLEPYKFLIEYIVLCETRRKVSTLGLSILDTLGKVFYLSIEERKFKKGTCQGRPGLHVNRLRSERLVSCSIDWQVHFTLF